jgi:hypothetical protein
MAENQQEFVDFEIEGDFEGVKEFDGGNFPLLPPREFIFEVTNVTQKTSSNNNNMVVVESTVAEGQDDDEAAAFTGQKAWTNYVLTDKALGRLKNLMLACKAPMDKFRASAILGAKYRGTITHSQSDGSPGPDGKPREARTFANVSKERPLDGGAEQKQEAAPPPPPPVTQGKAAATKPAGNSKPAAQQTRRA